MRSLFYGWLALISPFLCLAQGRGPRVINAMGLYQIVENVSLEASIGEVAVSTLTGDGKSVAITQGFLQPLEFVPCDNVNIEYYPNPTRDYLTLEVTGCDNEVARVDVIDIWGRRVQQLIPENNLISLLALSQGVYVLKIRLRSGIERAIQIVKVSE